MGGATGVLLGTKTERIDSCNGEEASVQASILAAFPTRRLFTSSKDSTDDKPSDSCEESMRLSEEKQKYRFQTLYDTLCSIMQDPQERALYKSFLHTEYDIQIWDLWRCVEAYEQVKVERLKSCTADLGLHNQSVLTRAEAIYATFLAPNAKCFVDGIPASYSANIRDQLERGRTPDYHPLNAFLVRALCSERLLMSFAKWLSSDEAKAEEQRIADRFHREAVESQEKDITSCSRLGLEGDSLSGSFRGHFEDLCQPALLHEDLSTMQPHGPPESPAETLSRSHKQISLTCHIKSTDGVRESIRNTPQSGCVTVKNRRPCLSEEDLTEHSGSVKQDENTYKRVVA